MPHIRGVFPVALVVMLVWGATPTATMSALDSVGPLAAALRTGLAGALALPIALALRLPLPRSRREWGMLIFSGLAAFACFPIFMFLGLVRTSASHAALIIAVAPLATGITAAIVHRQWPKKRWWIGGLIAIAPMQFLVPVFGIAIAIVVLSEPVTLPLVGSAGTIIGGVLIATWSNGRRG